MIFIKQGYKSWKGFSVPPTNKNDVIGTIRPLTNNDPSNSAETGFGLARPIKHARKGRDVTGRMNSIESVYLLDTLAITQNDFVDKEECKPVYKNTPEAKARRRSMYANTNLKSDYFNSLQACREKRCQTFDQRSFNFQRNSSEVDGAFYANCQPNKQGCKEVFYKPNNTQFAQQGAVSSSTRLMKLTNDTLNKTPVIAGKKNQPINYCIPVACSKHM
jgi:hypothetical protein